MLQGANNRQPCGINGCSKLSAVKLRREQTKTQNQDATVTRKLRQAHHISNLMPCSGIVFVKNAAPMVDSCAGAAPRCLKTNLYQNINSCASQMFVARAARLNPIQVPQSLVAQLKARRTW